MSYPQQPPVSYPQPYPAPAAAPPQAYPAPLAYPAPPAYPGQQAYPTMGGQLAVVPCRFCGCVPAVPVKFRGHQGILVIMRFLSLDGPFCRDCGLSTFRSMTAKTLVQGWYSYASVVIAPITILINVARRGKVARLPAPQANPWGPSRRPMDPGPRLFARPMTWIGLAIPFLLIALLIIAASLDS